MKLSVSKPEVASRRMPSSRCPWRSTAPEAAALNEPGRLSIRQNLQQRIRELELLLMERHRQLDMAEVHIRQLERRLQDAGLHAG
jgi:hypothetical protein